MAGYPNIYATVVFDLHPKIKDFIDQLNHDGQIDQDEYGYPYLIKSDRQGANIVTHISRNNRLENFVLNPRKKVAPICSWNTNDGFARTEQKRVTVIQQSDDNRQERPRRLVSSRAIESIVEGMLEG